MPEVHPKDIARALRSKRDEPYALTLEEMAEDDADVYVMKEDANTMLFAGGILSIITAVFISISIRRLFSDPSVRLIRQLVAEAFAAQNPSITVVTISADKPSPSLSAYAINGLWILSLVSSIYSAVSAALLKAWIAKYERQSHCCQSGAERFRTLFTYQHVAEYEGEAEEDRVRVSLDDAAVFVVETSQMGTSFFIFGFIIFLSTISLILTIVISLVTFTAVYAYIKQGIFSFENKNYSFHTPLTARLFKRDRFSMFTPHYRRRARYTQTPGHAEPILPQQDDKIAEP